MRKWMTLLLLGWMSTAMAQELVVNAPSAPLQLRVNLEQTVFRYELRYKGQPVILPSMLGMVLKEPAVALNRFSWIKADSSSRDETWQPVWGEYAQIRDQHKELRVYLRSNTAPAIDVVVVFRLFNEGLGIRYEFPQQKNLQHFIVAEEQTQFQLTGDHMTHWIPGDYDSNEFTYNHTRLSQVDASVSKTFTSIFAKTFFAKNAVQTPLMMKSDGGVYINIHEAALVNYPAMNLMIDATSHTLTAHLVPDAVGNRAYLQAPAHTPWRTIIVSDKATEILASNRMILNLNEPSKVKDPSFIQPQKFVGVWWEMHVGKGSWDYGTTQSLSKIVPHGHHSANTANVKRYIDFAAKNGIQSVLVEGWNVGWEDWFGKWKEDVFDFVTPYPDYDIHELQRYAAAKGVKIIMHHETSASVTNYERRMDTAYRFMLNHGMNAVKTGYVGYIIPRGEHHDGQWMVNHYQRVAEKTAQYGIMLDAHEPVRPTGLHRTYPNWMACEAARGNEFNAWSEGNPPEHETILPFTRLMGGPMDYTPGVFQTRMSAYDSSKTNRVHTTLAKQLALYLTMYSPLQMAADLPENYENHMDAFQFIRDVAVDWDDSKYLLAEPGDYVVVARKAKGSENWFLGAITDEQRRNFNLPLNFLPAGKKYKATVYRDAANANWDTNPMAYVVESFLVDAATAIRLQLAPGGGTAISLIPVSNEEAKKLKKYK